MKRSIALLLAVILLVALTACSGGATEPSASAASSAAPSAAASAAASTEPAEVSTEIILPLSSEPVTFTMWGCTPQAGADLVTENDSYARQELEKRTNVHIEWTHPTIGQETAQFNLMLASGILTDAITASFAYYTGGMDKYINDGFIVPLESYGQFYPNYNMWRSEQDLTLLSTVTDGGHIAGIHQLRVPYQPQWQGPVVREDLLDDIGFNKKPDEIVTLADWENVLTLFKDNGKKIPYLMPYNNNGLDPYILASFGLYAAGANTGFYQLDNKVHYFPYEDSFRDYLSLMSGWFSKGLIDTEFFSRDYPTTQAALLSGEVGIGSTFKAQFDYANYSTAGDAVHWAGISAPLKEAGQKFEALYALTSRMYYQGQVMSISTSCAEDLIPVILQYTDYGFTDEGATLYTYGVEGQAYDIVNGEIKLRDEVTKNPNGFSLNQTFNKYCIFHAAVYRYNWRRSENNISDEAKQLYTKWEKNYAEDAAEYPALSIAEADASTYASLFNDIDTYVKEFTMKIITGQGNLDSEWAGFKSQLDSMGVSDIVAMQQKALDGFYNRDTSLGFVK